MTVNSHSNDSIDLHSFLENSHKRRAHIWSMKQLFAWIWNRFLSTDWQKLIFKMYGINIFVIEREQKRHKRSVAIANILRAQKTS